VFRFLDTNLPSTRNAVSPKASTYALFMQQPGVDTAHVMQLLNKYLHWYLPGPTDPSSSGSSRPQIIDEGISMPVDNMRVVYMMDCVYYVYHLLSAYLDDVRFRRVDPREVWGTLAAEGTGEQTCTIIQQLHGQPIAAHSCPLLPTA
jgi:hypothetical protein